MHKKYTKLLKVIMLVAMLTLLGTQLANRSSDDQLGRVGGATFLTAEHTGVATPCMTALTTPSMDGSIRANAQTDFERAQSTPAELVPLGMTAGIKLFMEGAMVVGLSPVLDGMLEHMPAMDAGLMNGDIITGAGEHEVDSRADLLKALEDCDGSPITLSIRRGNKEMTVPIVPVCVDGVYRMGVWVRDSMAGIGTLTFYDPKTKVFGALGHSVNEVDTGLPMPLDEGGILPATVNDVVRGTPGKPGELRGDFDTSRDLGILFANSPQGIFGTLTDTSVADGRAAVPVAAIGEIKTGEAEILSNISGREVKPYKVEIVKIIRSSVGQVQDFMIRVTDPVLLARTGGIVQGMSGSPILQNGKLVGAVTHVLVDDPTRGYGVFLENMCHACYQTRKAA